MAVSVLEDIGDVRALPGLLERLQDADDEVRRVAALALREFRGEGAAEALLSALQHPASHVRVSVLSGLRELREPRALEPVLASLEDAVADVRREAVITLAYLQHARAREPLLRRLRDPDAQVRRAAVGAVRPFLDPALPDRRLEHALLDRLSDTDWRVRADTAALLGCTGWVAASVGLRAALADAYWQVRKEAAAALGQLEARDPEVVPALSALLDSELSELRRTAATALGMLKASAVVERLRALERDPDIEVRKAAARALLAIASD
jgi:HEAT repeat protein